MILVETDAFFRSQYTASYTSKYFRTQKAKKENKPSYFKYITSINRHHNGDIEINGDIGRKRFIWYTIQKAITRYNKECKKKLR